MAEAKARRRRRVIRKLRSKYRLLLINDSTFEERFSLRLSRMNVILAGLLILALTAFVVVVTIVFTPLKELIPGYADTGLKRTSYRSALKADSLELIVAQQHAYISNLRSILRGEVEPDSAEVFVPLDRSPSASDLAPSREDSLLRERVEREEAFALTPGGVVTNERRALAGVFFFPPLRGIVTSTFDRATGHFGVDIVTRADEAVKACLDGTVLLSSWTSDGGYVLQLHHANDLVSVYKHNSVLLKKVGDEVKAGEAIAIVGNSGELTSGPHLHFELWLDGVPIDPTAYMVFQ
ncbi:MAG: M23 family metallopeptidase [Flavobacteriales bacterium]|nr:M23 family metallopeptidase [Flavobacteriales bacterium]